jgi:ribosomal-protein-alanine N-acetyltransferase
MIDLRIETMKMTDLDDVMEIEEKAFSLPWSRWMFERELLYKEDSHFLVVRSGVKLMGYIGFWMSADEAHIVTIAVRNDFRRMGIGSILMASALSLAVRLGANMATLEVRVTNFRAQNLYDKFGFETVTIRRRFYSDTGEDAYVMWLRDLKYKLEDFQTYIREINYRREEET